MIVILLICEIHTPRIETELYQIMSPYSEYQDSLMKVHLMNWAEPFKKVFRAVLFLKYLP
jgi:hypothetical protein